MTQHDLAIAVDMQAGQIGRYERAEDNLSAVRLCAICAVLRVPMEDMFKSEEHPHEPTTEPVDEPLNPKAFVRPARC